jgi:hypothetical protein
MKLLLENKSLLLINMWLAIEKGQSVNRATNISGSTKSFRVLVRLKDILVYFLLVSTNVRL